MYCIFATHIRAHILSIPTSASLRDVAHCSMLINGRKGSLPSSEAQQRMEIEWDDIPFQILEDPDAAQYVSGIAVHWYTDSIVPPVLLDLTHKKFQNYWILSTEACVGFTSSPNEVPLGDWTQAEDYAADIIQVSKFTILFLIITYSCSIQHPYSSFHQMPLPWHLMTSGLIT